MLSLGMGRAQVATAPTPQQRLHSSGGYASRESWQGFDGGKAKSCNFRRRRSSLPPVSSYGGCLSLTAFTQQKTVRFNQFPFTPLLEVVGPGGGLSTVLIATPYDDTPVGESPGRRQTVATGQRRRLSSAGNRLAAATAERIGFDGDGF
jgi:hypothetical protein